MAGQFFSARRCAELSVIEHLRTQLNLHWSNPSIPIVKAFVKSYEVPVPVLCIRLADVDSERNEIGSDNLKQQYVFIIDIFAKSDGQRLDLADFIVNAIKGGCVFNNYSHSSSSREELDAVPSGRLTLVSFDSDSRVDFNSNSDEHDKFRHSLTFTMR